MKSIVSYSIIAALVCITGCTQTQAMIPSKRGPDLKEGPSRAPKSAFPEGKKGKDAPQKIDYNQSLHPLLGYGLEKLDLNYKLEIHYEEDLKKLVPYLILRTSKGDCDDESTPELIVFKSWGIFPLDLDAQVQDSTGLDAIFSRTTDTLTRVGSTLGLCLPGHDTACDVQASLFGNSLSLSIHESRGMTEGPLVWSQSFSLFMPGLPLKGLRPHGDRTFCN